MNKFVFSYFRYLSVLEGLSLLSLMFISMPARMIFDITTLSKHLGAIHGILFIMFVYTLISLKSYTEISLKDMAKFFILSSVPFGFILIDKQVKKIKQ